MFEITRGFARERQSLFYWAIDSLRIRWLIAARPAVLFPLFRGFSSAIELRISLGRQQNKGLTKRSRDPRIPMAPTPPSIYPLAKSLGIE